MGSPAAKRRYAQSEKGRAKLKAWKEANRERIRTQDRNAYAKLTPEQKAAKRVYQREWFRETYEERRELVLAKVRRYQETHQEQVRFWKRVAQRLRGKRITGKVTRDEWEAIVAAHGGRCAYCGRSDLPLTMDHVVPLSRGGKHDRDNIAPACRSCNSRKGNRMPEESRHRLPN